MTSVLDRSEEDAVAGLVIELMDEAGYLPDEFIPGLLVAAKQLAQRNSDPEDVLAEAITILEEEDEDEE